ncbi:hypothetical protein E2F48_11555 [Arthrobacter crusticola]|uniref:Uncharacterized protein n=1 Tax=Arthrobacter crusticola TaxID=2547960 RepID=A0A4R5TXD1_9MICC|nr:hypothetical protein [Arthrobacter crusticola]TDK25851.1 hypothetical protein E2F48_11555 [Arthrobacter crusticola]
MAQTTDREALIMPSTRQINFSGAGAAASAAQALTPISPNAAIAELGTSAVAARALESISPSLNASIASNLGDGFDTPVSAWLADYLVQEFNSLSEQSPRTRGRWGRTVNK